MGREKGYQAPPVPPLPPEQCPPLPDNYAVPPDEPEVLREFYLARHWEHKDFDRQRWRQYLHAYYWMIEQVDAQIGAMLGALRANGLEKDTLIVFSSDHGDGMAAHQWLSKCCHYEQALRVPMILSLPGVIPAGRVDQTHLVSNGPDFYATALDCAGVKIPAGCQGRSLMGLLDGSGGGEAWRDQVVSEIWIPGGADPGAGEEWKSAWGRMLRTERFKYSLYDRGRHREQLHDLANDPGETHSLAADPAYRDVLNEHRRRLVAWSKETRDTDFAPLLVQPE